MNGKEEHQSVDISVETTEMKTVPPAPHSRVFDFLA